MIDGTHKSQTRKTHGFSDAAATAKRNEKHEIGDIWEETDPKSGTVWKITQFDGFRSKVPANSVREEINEILNVPKTCPACDQKMKDVDEEHLNLKMYFIHKKCFSCVIKEETLIKARGKEAWEDYSRKKMLANAKSWMSDVDKEVEELKKAVTETYWQNADGRSEDIDVSAYMKKIDSDYQSLKEEILNNLESKNGN